MSLESTRSRRSVRRVACAAFGAAALSLLAIGAHAEDQFVEQKITVKYADLDLSKQQDAKVLYSRLRKAAKSACGWYDLRDTRTRVQHELCSNLALEEAVANVDHSGLTQLHDSTRRMRVAQGE